MKKKLRGFKQILLIISLLLSILARIKAFEINAMEEYDYQMFGSRASSAPSWIDIPQMPIDVKVSRNIAEWVSQNVYTRDLAYTMVRNSQGSVLLSITSLNSGVIGYDVSTGKYTLATATYYWFLPTGEYRYTQVNSPGQIAPNWFLVASNANVYTYSSTGTVTQTMQRITKKWDLGDYLFSSSGDTTQAIKDTSKETQEAIKDVGDTLKDDTVDSSSGGDFFGGFESDSYGLTSIVSAPLELIKALGNQSCSDLPLPLPYIDKPLTLPCMNNVYKSMFPGFLVLWQTITTGFISYYVVINLFSTVKNIKSPDNDDIEVVDL